MEFEQRVKFALVKYSGFGFQTCTEARSLIGAWVEEFDIRVYGVGVRVDCFGIRVKGFGIRVDGFGNMVGWRDSVSGFGVRIWC